MEKILSSRIYFIYKTSKRTALCRIFGTYNSLLNIFGWHFIRHNCKFKVPYFFMKIYKIQCFDKETRKSGIGTKCVITGC